MEASSGHYAYANGLACFIVRFLKRPHEALEIIALFVDLFGDLARTIGADLLRYCAAAQHARDRALLERVARALDGGETAAEDPKIIAILEEAKATGVLDEAALAELPESLVDWLRAAWSERSGEDQKGSLGSDVHEPRFLEAAVDRPGLRRDGANDLDDAITLGRLKA